MAHDFKSEFNDPHVKKHRRAASRRPDRLADPVSGILSHVVSDFEIPSDPRITMLKGKWEQVAGAQIAKHCEPGFIKDFTLYVYVTHPEWVHEIIRVQRLLLAKVQKEFDGRPIRKIRVKLDG